MVGGPPIIGRRWRETRRAIGDALARYGWWNGFIFLFARGLERVSIGRARLLRFFVLARPIGDRSAERPAGDDQVIVREIDASSRLLDQIPGDHMALHRRLQTGNVCIAASTEDRFLGHLWLRRARHDEEDARALYVLDPSHKAMWGFDVRVEDDEPSGRSIATRLWDGADDYMRAHGVEWTVSRIPAFAPSTHDPEDARSALRIASITFLKLGNAQLGVFTCSPYLSLSWRSRSRPRILIKTPRPDAPIDAPAPSRRPRRERLR